MDRHGPGGDPNARALATRLGPRVTVERAALDDKMAATVTSLEAGARFVRRIERAAAVPALSCSTWSSVAGIARFLRDDEDESIADLCRPWRNRLLPWRNRIPVFSEEQQPDDDGGE